MFGLFWFHFSGSLMPSFLTNEFETSSQEVLEQEMAVRTTPLAQPVDVGVAPMEE